MRAHTQFAALLLAALLLLAAGRLATAEPITGTNDAALAKRAADELMAALKNELQAAIQKGGPVAAVDICSTRAQALTAEIPARIGRPDVTVKRTSLKFRNPANRPTPEEKLLLQRFAAQLQEGKTLQPVTQANGGGLSYYRPIITEKLCLTCHGDPTQMDSAVRALLRQRYPRDRAVGFAAGDLRGMVSITLPAAPQ